MGTCFSRGKGRQPVPSTFNEKEESAYLSDDNQAPLNGNSILIENQHLVSCGVQSSDAHRNPTNATATTVATTVSMLNPSSVTAATGPLVVTAPVAAALQRERSVRTFYGRMPGGVVSGGGGGGGSNNGGSCNKNAVGGGGSGGGGNGGGAAGEIGRSSIKAVSDSKINALFEVYKDSNEDSILADGIERLCSDLGLSPDEFKVLILAWKLDASQMCRFTRTEFVNGCRSMGVESLRGVQNKLPEIAAQVASNPDVFKDLYRFTFRFGLDHASGQRILPSDMALVLWRLVFSVREPPILDRWLKFIEFHHVHVRGIPRDTWNMFLNFSEAVGEDLSSYDDTEAWPSIFDDFVEYENDQANQNYTSSKEDKKEFIH